MLHNFKVLVLGEAAVGKTSIATRYTTGGYKESHLMTVGANFMLKNIELENGTLCRLNIWDTAGQERFRRFVESYYRGGKGVILCFDITRYHSFETMDYWKKSAEANAKDAKFLLIGNKFDLEEEREVPTKEASEKAAYWGVPYFETSAKLNQGIADAFLTLTREMVAEIGDAKNKKERSIY